MKKRLLIGLATMATLGTAAVATAVPAGAASPPQNGQYNVRMSICSGRYPEQENRGVHYVYYNTSGGTNEYSAVNNYGFEYC